MRPNQQRLRLELNVITSPETKRLASPIRCKKVRASEPIPVIFDVMLAMDLGAQASSPARFRLKKLVPKASRRGRLRS